MVVTPPPSSGQPGKLWPQQPTRSKPASVEGWRAAANNPKTTHNSYPVDPNLCYPVNKFNSTRFLLETPLPATHPDGRDDCVCTTGWRQPPPNFKFWPEKLSEQPLVTLIWPTGLFDEENEKDIEGDTVWPSYWQCSDRLSLAGSDLLW